MTIHDDELQQLIGSAVDPSQLKHFDADSIARVARLRASRRRKIMIGAAGAVAVAASASAILFGLPGGQPSPVAQPTAQPEAPRMRPACPPPQVTIPNVTLDRVVVLKSTTVGAPVTIEAVLQSRPGSRVLHGVLIVAKPGSSPGGGNPLPPDAALRPENQLASGQPVVDVVPNGQRLTITFQPTAPGSYPVFFVSRYLAAAKCTGPAPAAGRPIETAGGSMMQLGEIVVK